MDAVKKRKLGIFLLAILVIIFISLILILLDNKLVSSANRLFSFPSSPSNLYPKTSNTSTPNGTQISMNETQNFNCCAPTLTPLVISQTIDLSPNLSEKYTILVSHSDGSVEEILIGPLHTYSNLDIFPVPDDLIKQLKLQPGDKIIGEGATIFHSQPIYRYTFTPYLSPTRDPNFAITQTAAFSFWAVYPYPYPNNQGSTRTPTPQYSYPYPYP